MRGLCTIIGACVFGLFIAGIAHFPVQWFIWFVRWLSGLPRKRTAKAVEVPPWFLGMFERVLAYAIFFLGVDGAPTILLAWIVAKLASNWQRLSLDRLDKPREQEIITHSLIALMAGTLSVAIGAAAGAIARLLLPPWC